MEKQIQEQNEKEQGATMVEYALLVALVAVLALAAIKSFGQGVSQSFSTVDSQLKNPNK